MTDTEQSPDFESRVRRRRRTKSAAAITLAALAVAAVPLAATWLSSGGEQPTASENREGWRWESYRGVQLQVPEDWEYGAQGADWCAAGPEGASPPKPRPGAVGRPGVVLGILCPAEHPPLAQREPSVKFYATGKAAVVGLDGGWVEETRELGEAFVTVFSSDENQRELIFGSAEVVSGEDAHGCAPDHRAATGRDYRPDAGALDDVGNVESISACRYARDDQRPPASPILSSSRLTGDDAGRAVDAIRAAPVGTGPNDPGNCAEEVKYGEEILVLVVRGDEGERDVVVRYSGCDGHGIDDGVTQRKLTADVLKPVLGGPNQPTGLSGSVGGLVW